MYSQKFKALTNMMQNPSAAPATISKLNSHHHWACRCHYSDVIISAMASQITNVSIVCSTVCSGADQRKYQSSASLVFLRGNHRWQVDSLHKEPVTRKMFPFDDVIMARMLCHHIRFSFTINDIACISTGQTIILNRQWDRALGALTPLPWTKWPPFRRR